MSGAPLLELRGVAVEIGGREPLVDVSLEVAPGGCLGIVGETGSGKSLSCRAAIGLLGRIGGRVARGSVVFDGIDLTRAREGAWRRLRGRRIGFVPQTSISGLDPVMSVRRQLREAISAIDPQADPDARARELLERVHMPGVDRVLRSYAHELSGGMRQRLMIALALVGRPELLIADEPTTALDVTVQKGILGLLTELRRETGLAVVLVTHDLGIVRSVADRVAIMYAGKTVETGPTARVFERPLHPYTRALLAAMPVNARAGEPLVAIPGTPPGLDERPDGCPFAARCPHAADLCRSGEVALEQHDDDHRVACRRVEELVAGEAVA